MLDRKQKKIYIYAVMVLGLVMMLVLWFFLSKDYTKLPKNTDPVDVFMDGVKKIKD